MIASREAGVIRVAAVVETLDHAGPGRVEGECVLLLDQAVCRISRVRRTALALGARHGIHEARATARVGGVEARLAQHAHGVAPLTLGVRGVAGGRLQY